LCHKKFRMEIIREMVRNVGMVITRVQRGRPSSSVTQLSRLEARNFSHWPVKGTKRRCVVCSQKKMRSTSSFFCRGCGVALCVYPSFEDYHTKINFT
jgi:predicted nucleic acid binding AN1-type Zn finger protein